MIGRYRREIRYDLHHECGVDLAEWYAAGRWVGLLELIDMLPAACRLNEAIANDPETAEYLAGLRLDSKGAGGEEWSPRVSEYTLDHHMFQAMISELKQVKQAVIAGAGGKPQPEKPFPSPRTAIDRALEKAERDWAVDFVAQFGFDADDI